MNISFYAIKNVDMTMGFSNYIILTMTWQLHGGARESQAWLRKPKGHSQ